MAQKTNLNATPYYDDFKETNNFHRVLFRPGYAVQARELTQLQSQLQYQIEAHGSHIFKEGALVVPGRGRLKKRTTLKLESTFNSIQIDPSQYYNEETPVILTGAKNGYTALVQGYQAATSTDQPLLFITMLDGVGDVEYPYFEPAEQLSANVAVSHSGTAYAAGQNSIDVYTSLYVFSAGETVENIEGPNGPSTTEGLDYTVEAGIYYIRGHFVHTPQQSVAVSTYTRNVNKLVGFETSENIITPENNSDLLDNSQGYSNFAAKGAHRLEIDLKLVAIDDTGDKTNFVKIAEVKRGEVVQEVRVTEYSHIGDTMARRTHDESGNYTVRPFQYDLTEGVTINENVGRYIVGATTDDRNLASAELLTLKVSPGKAYVDGYELEKTAPTLKDVTKARDIDTINAGISTFKLGNYALITSVFGTPDVTEISGEASPFNTLQLYDTATASRGAASGTHIGVARARAIEYYSDDVGSTASVKTGVYKLFMFDIRPFTQITLGGTPSPTLVATHTTGGVQIKGNTSGATGFVYVDGTSGTNINLTNVVGEFVAGEKLIASDSIETGKLIETAGNADITISSIKINTFGNARSVFMDDDDSGQDFSADFVTEAVRNVFADFILEQDITSSIQLEDGTASAGNVIQEGFDTVAAVLKEAENNVSLIKFPKGTIKTLLTETNNQVSDTQYTVRRQFIGTTNSSGVVTFNTGTNETFLSHSEKDYTMSILTAGGGTGAQGDVVGVTSTISGTGTTSITITDAAVLGASAKVKFIATMLKTSVKQKNKTVKLMKNLKVVATDADGAYGTRSSDKDISLGRADVFKLVAVYDSEATDTDAVAPTLTLSNTSGTFIRGEEITGATSIATGRCIDISSPMSYSLITGIFTTGEIITGVTSGAKATISSQTEGDKIITRSYLLDTGMRDNFYDIAKIIRKPSFSSPTGRLLVIYDYMEHGSGDLMTVDSYTDIAGRMTYEDIPAYSATKVDPDAPKPGGLFKLQDSYDFRPRLSDIAGTSSTLEIVDQITANSFDFNARSFSGTGSSMSDVIKPGSLVQADFEYFLGKKASVFLTSQGDIRIIYGASSETPVLPKPLDKTMKLCDINLPPYTFRPSDVKIDRTRNQRFTMKDIGNLQNRITDLEYYTTLSLLEKKAQTFETTDANGLNRFKSGFVVDNFTGHRVGDTIHPDYKCSMDFQAGELRPINIPQNIGISETATTDSERASAGYQKTGDLITLPYTEVEYTSNIHATSVERVTPLLQSQWRGLVSITPTGDEWFETEVAPEIVINQEGNYNAVANTAAGLGTVWNAWQTTWSGVIDEQTTLSSVGNTQGGRDFTETRTLTTQNDLTRTGVRYSVEEKIDKESQGFRVISKTLIPFCRSRNIKFDAEMLKPRMTMYLYFDKTNATKFVTPESAEFSGDTIIVEGSPMVTNGFGRLKGTFRIPDPRIEGNPQFKTGEIEFRLTSSEDNVKNPTPTTSTRCLYYAKGLLETQQETIVSSRNGVLVAMGQSERSTSFNTQSEVQANYSINPPPPTIVTNTVVEIRTVEVPTYVYVNPPYVDLYAGGDDWADDMDSGDPVAQTFMIDQVEGDNQGKFITSIDLFFGNKPTSSNHAVFCEIRNVVNGYPGPKVLPFARVIKYPNDINTSEDGTVATNFKFPSPIYSVHGTEYSIIIGTLSPEYKIWKSNLGESDQFGNEVARQPHVGVFFRGHNNRAWVMGGTEDLTFKMNIAKFDIQAAGKVSYQNDDVPVKPLLVNPITITDNTTTVKIRHRDHGMYSTSNNVIIDGVSSGLSTTLSSAINSTAVSIPLTSATNFGVAVDGSPTKYAALTGPIYYAKIGSEIISYTGVSTNTLTGVIRAVNSTTAANHANTTIVEFYQIHKVPLYEINKTHTAIANIDMDSYTIASTSTAAVDGSGGAAEIGGNIVTATENYMADLINLQMSTLELSNTEITGKVRQTTGTSPDGTEISFVKSGDLDALPITLGDNYYNTKPFLIASPINETNEIGGSKSLNLDITLKSNNYYLSPVIDIDRSSMIAVGNRVSFVDEASDIFPTTDYVPSTAPDGDSNSAIYFTKKIGLESPATSLRVIIDANVEATADIKILYKILRTDDASDFDELGYRFFNDGGTFATSGGPDTAVPSSLTQSEFREYVYTAGITDDGIGEKLEDFIAFQIKIVMLSRNTARPPRLKDLRVLALAT